MCFTQQYQKTQKVTPTTNEFHPLYRKNIDKIKYLKNSHMSQIKHYKFRCFHQKTVIDIELLQL